MLLEDFEREARAKFQLMRLALPSICKISGN